MGPPITDKLTTEKLLQDEAHCLAIESSRVGLLQQVYSQVSGEEPARISSGFKEHAYRLEHRRESTDADLQRFESCSLHVPCTADSLYESVLVAERMSAGNAAAKGG